MHRAIANRLIVPHRAAFMLKSGHTLQQQQHVGNQNNDITHDSYSRDQIELARTLAKDSIMSDYAALSEPLSGIDLDAPHSDVRQHATSQQQQYVSSNNIHEGPMRPRTTPGRAISLHTTTTPTAAAAATIVHML
jgi:hypothetical protein